MKLLGHLKQSVLPSRENDHHPHLLRADVIGAAFVVALLAEVALLAAFFLPVRQGDYLASVLPAVVSTLTNDARSAEKLAALTPNEVLAEAAATKAADMAEKGYFAHVSPDGTQPWTWVRNAGYSYEYAGENLAVNFADSEDVVNAWLASPAHRANILKREYTEIGIGTATGEYKGKEAVFVVQFFAKPAAAQVATGSVIPSAGDADVLGAESEPLPWYAGFVSSPHASSTKLFLALASFFLLVLVFGFLFTLKVPRFAPTLGVLLLAGALLGLALGNDALFLTNADIPHDTQAAAIGGI